MTEKKSFIVQYTNSFNNFIVCTDQGFRTHDLNTCALKVNCEEIEHGVSLCQSYGNSSLFFLVGTINSEKFPTNKLCLWDDKTKTVVAEVQFFDPIIDLKVVGGWVILADKKMTYIFNFEQESGLDHAIA